MTVDVLAIFETFNLIFIQFAFAIFTPTAFKGKSLCNFRLQLALFLLIWVMSERPHIAESLGLIAIAGYQDAGLYLHAFSMVVFALFVGWRSLKFATFHPPPATGALSVPTERPKVLKG